jgi:paraquat-inducible protein A
LNARPESTTVACPECDLLQGIPPLASGDKALCMRCGCLLGNRPVGPRDLPLALTVTGAIVYCIANAWPLMDLSAAGRDASTTIAGGAYQMWMDGQEIIAILIAFCAVIAPGGYLLLMLTLQLAARLTPPPHWVAEMLRWAHHFQMWSMLEVMMLGILVALIKIAELATVHAGIAMYAVGALMLLFPGIMATFDARELWRRVTWVDDPMPNRSSTGGQVTQPGQ